MQARVCLLHGLSLKGHAKWQGTSGYTLHSCKHECFCSAPALPLPACPPHLQVLLQLLKAIRTHDRTDKVVLVSNYTEALDLLETVRLKASAPVSRGEVAEGGFWRQR